MEKQKVYIFGNPLLNMDNLPIRLKSALKKYFPDVSFIHLDPNENLKPDKNGGLIIIDSARGVNGLAVIENLDLLETESIYSAHDLDLAFTLKLLQKIGLLKKISIIAVSPNLNEKKALQKIKPLLEKILSSYAITEK
jgi:Ni,Fe-hydrogenase maturation factor